MKEQDSIVRLKNVVAVIGIICLALFFLSLLLGFIFSSPTASPSANFMSDEWFRAQHPIWIGISGMSLLYIIMNTKTKKN